MHGKICFRLNRSTLGLCGAGFTKPQNRTNRNRRNRAIFKNCYSTSFDKPSGFLFELERFCRKPWFSSGFQRFF
uniref:Uncharacterized protein n=1 Tax=Arundo donax TaxID=35708 RepID=A0A0A9EM78_ARUDO